MEAKDLKRAEEVLKRRLGAAYYFLKPEEKRQQISWLLQEPQRRQPWA